MLTCLTRARRGLCILFLAASSIALAGCRFFPEPPPGWTGSFTADAVLAKSLDQGSGAETPVADYFASASVTGAGGDRERLQYAVLWKRPGLWRVERIAKDGSTSRVVHDGRTCAEVRGGAVIRRGAELCDVGVRFNRYLFLARWFRDGPGSPPEIVATDATDDGARIRIEKRDERGRRFELAIDAQTLRPVRVREWIDAPPAAADDAAQPGAIVDTLLSDYGPDGRGGIVPHRFATHSAGALVQEMVIQQIRWNQGLRAEDFAIPGEPDAGG